jgi:hypothetical protein
VAGLAVSGGIHGEIPERLQEGETMEKPAITLIDRQLVEARLVSCSGTLSRSK